MDEKKIRKVHNHREHTKRIDNSFDPRDQVNRSCDPVAPACDEIVTSLEIPVELSSFEIVNPLICTDIPNSITPPPILCHCFSCPEDLFCEVTSRNIVTVTAFVQITIPIAVPCPGGFSEGLTALCGPVPEGSQLTTAVQLIKLVQQVTIPGACLVLSCSSSFGPLAGCSVTADRTGDCLSIHVNTVFGTVLLDICSIST
jgi:hypothetical protein